MLAIYIPLLLQLQTQPVTVVQQPTEKPASTQTVTKPETRAPEDQAKSAFVEKLEAALLRDVATFAELNQEGRREFLDISMSAAEGMGLKTEQGIASYVMGVWYAGINFHEASADLEQLLKSQLPEARKVQAMNEWISSIIGNPGDIAAADEKLRNALDLTKVSGQ